MDHELAKLLQEAYSKSVEAGNGYNQGAYNMATLLATKFLQVSWEDIRELEQESLREMWQNNTPSC